MSMLDVVVLPCVPADRDRTGLGADAREHPGTAEDERTLSTGFVEFVVRRRHGARRGDSVDTVHLSAAVSDVDGDAFGAETIEDGFLAQVAARHLMPHLGEDQCDRAHAGPTDADHVKPLRRAQVDRCDRRRQRDDLAGDIGSHASSHVRGGRGRRRHRLAATSSIDTTNLPLRCASPAPKAARPIAIS